MAERYRREIEEILENVNESPPAETGAKRGTARRQRSADTPPMPGRQRRAGFDYTPGRVAFTGIALLALALVLTLFGVGFTAPLVWIGIGLLILAYVLFFTKPRRTMERRWRGQSIEDPPQPGPLQRLRRWLTRGK